MSLTIERPETEARLIRFATSRGLTPLDALDELLNRVEQREATEATEAILESFTEEGEDVSHEEVFARARQTVKESKGTP